MNPQHLPSSFRDPDGFLFRENGIVLRQVNASAKTDYDLLMQSGLYQSLIDKGWLIPHAEQDLPEGSDAYKILRPEQLLYVSYPYEWSFSQLRDAALLTMDIQLEALRFGMQLKDATAYNVQFHQGRPVFIDTLSFEAYPAGQPWVAYRQFCQHFLGPLALICYRDYRLHRLLRGFIDGIPLDLASTLLPRRTWFKYSLLAHLHLHARAQSRFEDAGRAAEDAASTTRLGEAQLTGLMTSLRNAVSGLQWRYTSTEWGDYYQDTNYQDATMGQKESLVRSFLDRCKSGDHPIAADFGANTGRFSRIASTAGYFVLSHDIDEVAVDKNYLAARAGGETSILPLVQDLTNPSPAIGWANAERMNFGERHHLDVGMALALIHHIALSNNVPLPSISAFFRSLCEHLIIEFVPKSDSQVKRLLATREDVFPNYDEQGFEAAFSADFELLSAEKIEGSERTLYLMKRRATAGDDAQS